MNARNGTIPGFKQKTYHPVIRLGGFVAIIVALWVIVSSTELITTLVLALLITMLVLLFVFNRVPAR